MGSGGQRGQRPSLVVVGGGRGLVREVSTIQYSIYIFPKYQHSSTTIFVSHAEKYCNKDISSMLVSYM